MKYKLIAYTLNGALHTEIQSNYLEFLERYKNKVNYRIQIYEKHNRCWNCIYSEV